MFQKNLLEGMGYLNLEAENQFSLYQISQKIIKFLLSVSLFSLSFFSLLFLLRSLNAFLIKIFSNSIFKFCMLFLFHGLLVLILIAKCSGPIHFSSSPTAYQTREIVKNNVGETGNSESKELEIKEPASGGNDEEIEFPVAVMRSQKNWRLQNHLQGEIEFPGEEEEEAKEESLITVEQKDEILNSEENGAGAGKEIVIIDEDLHDVEETEELNKKCEDFIGRMKAARDVEETEELNKKCENFIRRMKAARDVEEVE